MKKTTKDLHYFGNVFERKLRVADADEADAAFLGGAFAAVAVVEFCAT